jgi:hypothetical protein
MSISVASGVWASIAGLLRGAAVGCIAHVCRDSGEARLARAALRGRPNQKRKARNYFQLKYINDKTPTYICLHLAHYTSNLATGIKKKKQSKITVEIRLDHQPSQSLRTTQQPHSRNRTASLSMLRALLLPIPPHAILHPPENTRIAEDISRLHSRRVRDLPFTHRTQPGILLDDLNQRFHDVLLFHLLGRGRPHGDRRRQLDASGGLCRQLFGKIGGVPPLEEFQEENRCGQKHLEGV